MQELIDLTNLRSMTDGDAELERALFQEFMLSFTKGIEVLSANIEPESAGEWQLQAHALKGIAINLGAEPLALLCKDAQEHHTQKAPEKTLLLQQIKAEYQRVETYLTDIMAHG